MNCLLLPAYSKVARLWRECQGTGVYWVGLLDCGRVQVSCYFRTIPFDVAD